ncbi:cysteine synthase CysM [Deinococcus radiophilus]|uniref:Cysteine synthase n=1 Tax=Deinococcus radiophilus TaxID=32062 RepID=A0A3S0KFL1_9DEIO|nr:cysteine synthase CysM [Deinococcus radiophilus]RTR25599.1 cysteine synthase CysM [Deinococcus radiophilus]
MTEPHVALHPSALDLIGNTPLVRLHTLSTDRVDVYGKLEGQNPGGSVKDRAARAMIEGLLERGELPSGTRLIEATSGNTGIALAMIARLRGLELELVMPENATAERVQTMRAYGATVTLTPADGGMEAAIDHMHAEVGAGRAQMLNQFGNPDNPRAHYETTGPEIWRDTGGRVTHFVSSMGTTGTIMGVSRYLKEQSDAVQIVGVQPTEGASIPGIRRWPEAYLPANYQPERVDRVIDVSEDQARAMTRALAREEAIFAGMSSGGAAHAAAQLARELTDAGKGGLIVTIVCDRGDRYLSSDLFA